MDELFALLIVALYLPHIRRNARIVQARVENDRTRDALNEWIWSHPDASLSSPRAQELVGERLLAWRAYTKACPAVDDGGVLQRYLEASLDDVSDQPAPHPMP